MRRTAPHLRSRSTRTEFPAGAQADAGGPCACRRDGGCQLTGRGTAPIGAAPRADESGGALSLWVVLMVPVSAFAAVVAMAGPQRLAAESSVDDAADDLAALAVVWRDGHGDPSGAVPAFPPECSIDHPQWIEELRSREEELRLLEGEQESTQESHAEIAQDGAQSEANKQAAEEAKKAAEEALVAEIDWQEGWKDTCETVFEWIARDLGYLGVDVNSLSGFYSDSYAAGDGVPCKISKRVEVLDSVHVGIVADWVYAGWAAAQVWPDGTRMGAESIGRLRRNVSDSNETETCSFPDLHDDAQGRRDSRDRAQKVPKSGVIGG